MKMSNKQIFVSKEVKFFNHIGQQFSIKRPEGVGVARGRSVLAIGRICNEYKLIVSGECHIEK